MKQRAVKGIIAVVFGVKKEFLLVYFTARRATAAPEE
jgi:hypothetical protein